MPNVALVPETPNQSLPEFTVGKAGSTCVFPGIQQCFAIAGIRASNMICAHVSPGATAQNITDTFDHFADLGGTWVLDWFIIGPCAHFFGTGSAPWKSAQDIRGAFRTRFGDSGANHWLMDVTAERDQFGFGVDIRAIFDATTRTARFSYKKAFAAHINTWTDLNAAGFNRI